MSASDASPARAPAEGREPARVGESEGAPGAMDEVREGMELAFLDATQDARVRENIHAAAYGSSPLGAPLLCPPSQLHT